MRCKEQPAHISYLSSQSKNTAFAAGMMTEELSADTSQARSKIIFLYTRLEHVCRQCLYDRCDRRTKNKHASDCLLHDALAAGPRHRIHLRRALQPFQRYGQGYRTRKRTAHQTENLLLGAEPFLASPSRTERCRRLNASMTTDTVFCSGFPHEARSDEDHDEQRNNTRETVPTQNRWRGVCGPPQDRSDL